MSGGSGDPSAVLHRLFETIESRKGADPESSYTAKLYAQGGAAIAQKLGEEAVEAVIAALEGKKEDIVSESADLLYHLLVVWAQTGVAPADVWAELERREGIGGIEEKKSRK